MSQIVQPGGRRQDRGASVLCLALAGGIVAPWIAPGAGTYELYQPDVARVTIYGAAIPDAFEGQARRAGEPLAGDPMPYNHCPALAYFDGRFHCVWQGTQLDLRENQEGQRIWLSTSRDFREWTPPEPLAALGNPPVAGRGVQKQPGLLNYLDRELWCVWHHHGGPDAGVYFSRLQCGETVWENRRLWTAVEIEGQAYTAYPTQDPVLFSNGRVAAPCVFILAGSGKTVRLGGALYTDDGGATWNVGGLFRSPETSGETWEPFFFEQADSAVRVFCRSPFFETLTGTGARPGEPLVTPGFSHRSWMEGVSERPWVGRLPCGRFVMLKHDAYSAGLGFGAFRRNLALAFSRSGADDFVFGPPVSDRTPRRWSAWDAAYAQGCVADGRLYVAHSESTPRGPHGAPRSIRGIEIGPLPAADRLHLWPRTRMLSRAQRYRDGSGRLHDYAEELWMHVVTEPPRKTSADGRTAVSFGSGAAAGIELPAGVPRGGALELAFDANIRTVQAHGLGGYPDIEWGKLTLLTVGDLNPLRLAVAANAGPRLWFFDGWAWHAIEGFERQAWRRVRIRMDGQATAISLDGGAPRIFEGARLPRNPVCYFGEGVIEKKHDGQPPVIPLNNLGSLWLLDLDTLEVR